MERVNVTGGWIDLRDPKEVSERLRRPVLEKSISMQTVMDKEEDTLSADDLSGLFGLNDLVAVALIAAWSFEYPITLDGLLDLPSGVYDEVLKLVSPKLQELMPNFGVDVDPKAPIDNLED